MPSSVPFFRVEPNVPVEMVESGMSRSQSYASTAFSEALGLIDSLRDFSVDPVQVNADFTPPDLSAAFERPETPVVPDVEFSELYSPGTPRQDGVSAFVPATEPSPFSEAAPKLDFGSKPAPFTGSFDEPAPSIPTRAVPAENIPAGPSLPPLFAVSLPDVPEVALPVFSSSLPVFSELAPGGNFLWSEGAYSTEMVTALQAKILGIMSGGNGLPVEVQRALWDNARVREDVVAKKAVQEATEEFAARGFSLPGGVLAKRLMEVRQDNANKASSLSRDILIKATDVELDQLKFSVSQGIALEQILGNISMQIAQRAFDAAKYTIESAIAVFNAKVGLFNARLEGYKADASVYREIVQAEIAKLERYKILMDGQKIIGELNAQQVEMYKAQWQGVMAAVEVYKAQVQAVVAQVEADKGQIEIYRGKIEAFKSRVDAKNSEFNAWATSITGEAKKADAYGASVQAYAAKISAYRATNDARADVVKIDIEKNRLYLQEYGAKLDYMKAQITEEQARITAAVQVFDGQAKLYVAEGEMEKARVASDAQLVQMKIEEAKVDAETDLKKAQLSIAQVQETAKLLVQALDGAARTAAQLAASALSSVHYGASISGSLGLSTTYSRSDANNYSIKG